MLHPTSLEFIIHHPEFPERGRFSLKDLPGSGRRIDVICRCLSAAFDWAPSRKHIQQVMFMIFLGQNALLVSQPQDASGRGETWWASNIQAAVRGAPPEWIKPYDISLREWIQMRIEEGKSVAFFDENGVDADDFFANKESQYSFMVGNHRGFTATAVDVIKEHQLPAISLGATSYLGSHCIAATIARLEMKKG